MLEQMSPWEYQEIRKVLGHGSGFDSPGVKELRPAMARLGEAFHAARERAARVADRDVQAGPPAQHDAALPVRRLDAHVRVRLGRLQLQRALPTS